MTPTTLAQLKAEAEQIAALDAKRTPGEWKVGIPDCPETALCGIQCADDDEWILADICNDIDPKFGINQKANADFLACAPRMASLIQRQSAELERLTAECEALRGLEKDAVRLRAIIAHWDEFGPQHGFAETVDLNRPISQQATKE